ncbi:MAG TPA: redox-regulated ATPase YchF [Bacteroidales bacterium]|nr:MAG: redox-regulated ATPase YchF [Bacteroidetes bacterium GWE2_42_24]OFY28330.1 MAG: redox-regulated ATPase YchF [Bacteroidetes bacterium GWF2_43_11]HBZ65620.1 redox-regulated ATPase YchF [Bacteroidales bacterium]
MALTCGIVGLTNSGKTTIFNCISNSKAQASSFTVAQKSNIGMITVPDDRLYKIDALIKSVRVVHTTVDIVDIPGLTKGGSKGEGNKFLTDIRNVDALIYVLRCFEDAQLPHIEGSIDPIRDKELVDFELQVKDIESVEKKIGRMEKAAKTGDKDAKHGLDVLAVYKDHLENLQPARTAPVLNDDKRFIEDIFLLTMKPVMYVCNVDDNSALNGNRYSEKVRESLAGEGTEILVIAGKLEAEIAELEDAEDRKVFLEDVGLAEPGVNKMIREAYSLLDLQTFFTAGPKEVRAWTIHRGMTAPQAAGVIHSDLERGFIRAEVIKYDDFMKYGTELACKEAGKLSVEGKNYVVGDGDLLHIRFNV